MRPSQRPFQSARCIAVGLSTLAASVVVVGPAGANDIDALLGAMTVEEKVSFLYGATDPESLGQAGYMPGVPRLGIPPLRLTDGPAGVRVRATATAMPAPVALAATFDPDRARRFGEVIGQEGRALRQDVLLSPMVNLVRVPQAGRNFETLGEDPLLASRLAEEEFGGIQGAGLIATIKHFVLNNQEHERRSVNANVDDQALHELYLPTFTGAIRGGAGAVMCSYNRVRGKWACDSAEVMTHLLRDQLGFEGWVMTDWGATHTLSALEAGLDQEMPGSRGRDQVFASELLEAAKSGTVPMSVVDRAVRRILEQMDRVGLLGETPPPRPDLDVEASAAVARDVALAGAVLLKNEDGALPLGAEELRSLVLIGPTAKTLLVGGGGSSRVIGFEDREKSPLEALVEKAGPAARITHASGLDLEGVPVPASALSLDESYGHVEKVDFTGSSTLPSTAEPDAYVWTGTLSAPADGEYDLMLQHSGGSGTLLLDGEVVLRAWFFGGSLIPTSDGLRNNRTRLSLTAGSHTIELKIGAGGFGPGPYRPTGPIELRLAWVTPERRQASRDEAVDLARGASAAVVFAYNEGTEGRDRASLALPGDQDALIEAVADACQGRTIIILNTGDPVLMPWVAKADAVLQLWYPGQEGGGVTASLLLGEANPGGKLPVTFPRSEADLPTTKPEQYPGVETDGGLEQWYSEGIFVGYRWYDEQDIEPLFPFGHGLSYSRFKYSDLAAKPSGDGFDVSFQVRNAGGMKGTEVPQVYIGPPSEPLPEGHAVAPQKLVGFERIELAPGEARRLTVHVGAPELSYWSKNENGWVVAPGPREVHVGASSRDIRLRGTGQPAGGGAGT